MASQGQPVRFRDCTCPGTPHNGEDGADDGDIIGMRDHLGYVAGAEVARMYAASLATIDFTKVSMVDGKLPQAIHDQIVVKMFELAGPVFLTEGPLYWNVVDERGPVEMTREALLNLTYSEGLPIVDKADDLYSTEVLSPLVKRTSELSGNTSNGKRTHRQTRSSSVRPLLSRPSSPNGSAGQPSPVNP